MIIEYEPLKNYSFKNEVNDTLFMSNVRFMSHENEKLLSISKSSTASNQYFPIFFHHVLEKFENYCEVREIDFKIIDLSGMVETPGGELSKEIVAMVNEKGYVSKKSIMGRTKVIELVENQFIRIDNVNIGKINTVREALIETVVNFKKIDRTICDVAESKTKNNYTLGFRHEGKVNRVTYQINHGESTLTINNKEVVYEDIVEVKEKLEKFIKSESLKALFNPSSYHTEKALNTLLRYQDKVVRMKNKIFETIAPKESELFFANKNNMMEMKRTMHTTPIDELNKIIMVNMNEHFYIFQTNVDKNGVLYEKNKENAITSYMNLVRESFEQKIQKVEEELNEKEWRIIKTENIEDKTYA